MTATRTREFAPAPAPLVRRVTDLPATSLPGTELPVTRQVPPSRVPSRRVPGRWSGLDGVRAVAVVAVVAYHFAPNLVPGGFLGVDVFFVLSGYLITRKLVGEYARRASLDLGRFYRHRARRLLPGLGLLLVVCLAASAVWRDQLATIRPATLAALGYVSNWWLSFDHQSYFVATGRPSMLQHLWSLAVEEQFYLLWPLIALVVLRARDGVRHPGRAARRVAVTAAALATASTAAMVTLAVRQDVPYGADGSRLYYGTDTHSMGLLLGAAAGALAADRLRPSPRRQRWLWASDVLAAVAALALLALFVTVGQYDGWLYRGGFLAVAGVACVVVAAVARRGSRLGRLLDCAPLRWLGARSYAIYLWHWPVAVLTRPGTDVPLPAAADDVLRVAVTLVLAETSYRWVERPVRMLGLRAACRAAAAHVRGLLTGRARTGGRLAGAAVALIVVLAAAVLVTGPQAPTSAAERAVGPVTRVRGTLDPPAVPERAASTRAGEAPAAPQPAAGPADDRISAYGDSVMLGARLALAKTFPGGSLDAVEGRQPGPILADVRDDAAHHRLHPVVVIGVGDNGLVDAADLRHTLEVLRAHRVRLIIVVNNRVGRPWEGPNNRVIAATVRRVPGVRLLDWHARSAAHSGWFYSDGIHLTPAGERAYTALLAALVR